MNSRNQDMILGIVFFGALLGLGVITIVLSDFSLGTEWHRAEFFSDDVGYLRPGDPVLLYGMAAGKVEAITRLGVPDLADAQATLAERHRQPIFFLALQLMGNRDDAMDVAQEAFDALPSHLKRRRRLQPP